VTVVSRVRLLMNSFISGLILFVLSVSNPVKLDLINGLIRKMINVMIGLINI